MLLHTVLATLAQAAPPPNSGDQRVWKFLTRHDIMQLVQLLLMAIAGAFGGVVYAIASLLNGGIETEGPFKDGWKATKGAGPALYVFGECVIGIGGACAAVFGLVTLGKAATNTADTTFLEGDHLYFIVLCVIGGFIANSLLTAVGEKLLKQVAETKENVEELKKKNAETEKNLERLKEENKKLNSQVAVNTSEVKAGREETQKKIAKLEETSEESRSQPTDVIAAREVVRSLTKLNLEIAKRKEKIQRTRALGGTESASSEEALRKEEAEHARQSDLAKDYVRRLADYSKRFPRDRHLHIVLANLHDVLGEQQTAIDVLKRFIKSRSDAGEDISDDIASAWFNIACEHIALMKKGVEPEAQKHSAIEALRHTLTISNDASVLAFSVQKAQVAGDHELDPLRGDPEFQALLKEFGIDPAQHHD